MPKKASKPSVVPTKANTHKRVYLSQSEVPSTSLSQALRISNAIFENYGGDASTPLEVAEALDMTPTSGRFRNLCGASIAYGLTDGGCNANAISVTELAERIFKPQEEDDDTAAKREALLFPRIVREFLEKYNGNQLPMLNIAKNVLEKMGVPSERTEGVYELIISEAVELSLVREIKGKRFVQLSGIKTSTSAKVEKADDFIERDDEVAVVPSKVQNDIFHSQPNSPQQLPQSTANNRVFVTHGKNRALVPPIKKLLEFGQLEAVVSVELQSVSKPVSDKVMDDMRTCSAAIIHVDDELRLMDSSAKEHVVLNPNVLIEIGAAMGLYGRSFILLVKEDTKLPSNLQGLFEVRYKGETLDGDSTIRLMEAINALKKAANEEKH